MRSESAPKSRLSYANVTATLALFIALGGSSWAAPVRHAVSTLVTSKQIKDGTIAQVDLSKPVQAQLAKVGAAGPAGPTGAAGATGPKGADGKDGAPGKDGLAGNDGHDGTNATLTGVTAGGSLAGTYPSPRIATNAVGGGSIIDHSLSLADVARASLTFTEDLPSIAGGACTSFRVAVTSTNTLTRSIPIVNAPGNFFNTTGLVYNATIGINAGDPVVVHVCNITAGAIDPPEGGWIVATIDQ